MGESLLNVQGIVVLFFVFVVLDVRWVLRHRYALFVETCKGILCFDQFNPLVTVTSRVSAHLSDTFLFFFAQGT